MTSCGLSYNTIESFQEYLKDEEMKLEPAITELVSYPLDNNTNNGENNNKIENNGNNGNNGKNIEFKNYNKTDLTPGFENDPYLNLNDQLLRKRHVMCPAVRNIIYMEHKKHVIFARVSTCILYML